MTYSIQNDQERPTFFTRGYLLFQIFLSKLLNDKKTYILILVTIFPLLRILTIDYADALTFIDLIESGSIFGFIIMPLISLVLGISAVGDEKENKTISQLLAKPIYREEIVLAKWVSAAVVGLVVVIIDSLIIYLGLCIQINDFSILLNNLEVLFAAWAFLALWFLVYVSIFLLLGIWIDNNALGMGLLIAYFEAFFSQFLLGGASNSPFSISNHINYVASELLLGDYYSFNIPNYDPIVSFLICLGIIVGSLLLSLIMMRRKDFP
jgi:ABC-type transport system involved in multi-copper enzyme maturation permease subunit